MVLLVLAVIWGAVLVPPAMRARSESRPADSIGNFRRQLSVLRRTGPSVVAPAHPLRVPRHPIAPVTPIHRARPYAPESTRRARTLKRRRDVFRMLLAAMGITLVVGLISPFRTVLALHVVIDVLFIGYVAMLIQARNVAAEREMKLRFLPATAQPDNVLLLRRPAN